ncbi:MAG: hypothetical protein HOP13_20965 [Alphaproteobacteria bacterium]|nr:hypothetical protein [Alphaproteobacteria bacterium]
MSELTELVDKLRDTESAVAQLTRALEGNPADQVLRMNAASIQRRHSDLVRRLNHLLHVKQSEFVEYRIARDWTNSYPASVVARSLLAFQELVTSVFDSVRSGTPKMRYRPSPDSLNFSSLEFAGASTGSVVISLAVDNDRLLLAETELDRSFQVVERILSARESDDIALIAKEIGVAAITKAYVWADVSAASGLDTDFAWGKQYGDLHRVEISKADAELVKSLIENKSDESSTPVTLVGIMHGYDGATSYFHLEVADRQHIKGDIAPGVSKTCLTGARYRVTLDRKVTLKYATGEEKETYTLTGFESADVVGDTDSN